MVTYFDENKIYLFGINDGYSVGLYAEYVCVTVSFFDLDLQTYSLIRLFVKYKIVNKTIFTAISLSD